MHNDAWTKLRWDDFAVLLRVVEAGSFNQAALNLGIEQSTVSRQIARLESAIGRNLFFRTRQGVDLTPDGRRLLDEISEVPRLLNRGLQSARATNPRIGEIRIAVTDGIGTFWLARFLPAFQKRHQGVGVNIFSFDMITKDPLERYDSQLQMFRPTGDHPSAQRIATLHYIPYASADYVKRRGKPKTRADLLAHDLIELEQFVQTFGGWGTISADTRANNRIMTYSDSSSFLVTAVRQGLGVAMLPTYLSAVMPDLEPCDIGVGHQGIPIWHVRRQKGKAWPADTAFELIEQAFDRKTMPWFEESFVPPDDFFQRGRALGIPLGPA
jgi:DNA-binding transcriptional LysR family regulator